MADPSTSELVRGAAAGDQQAWNALVERYARLVWAVARGHRLAHADASDVFQVTWLRLVEQLDKLHDPERLAGWLSTTARRECLRVLRLRSREFPQDEVTNHADRAVHAAPDPEGTLLAQEERVSVALAFERLPDRCQALLRLLVADPRPSYDEVSRTLDMPVGGIGPTRGRCLDHLRRLLEEAAAPPPRIVNGGA